MATEWYVAEVVMKFTVDEDNRNEVHLNLFLIRAGSPAEAYEKALKCGRNEETSFENPAGKIVHIGFEGLSDLAKVDEELDDGSEIMFHRKINVSEKQLRSLVLPKERLRLFRPHKQAKGPDFASAEVLALLERNYGIARETVGKRPGSPRRGTGGRGSGLADGK